MVVLMRAQMVSWMLRGVVVGIVLATHPAPGGAQAPAADQVVEITAERFSFTPSQVRTTVGKVIEFRVESEDTMHGFRILGTDINVEVPKRGKGPAIVRFTPREPGKVIFECSHTCGAGHAFMRGEIVVSK